eukprot:CAMPEP_0116153182 /NCGR_PEP_ID=MMETSP0329-20121206/21089_1 /TAXON_ID=697910 /ORGANISM="Pseudo-nitzschia arenysensis, Strain B593" /LENGTH=1038 /DNA_ID=CAMNT_0003650035 /DNA_START=421 /DNA_END=3537 /DNA_ORIENTATION=-
MREAMLSPKHTVGTPRTSAAATINSLARKRNRTPSDSRKGLPRIESEVFQLSDELVVPKGAATANQVGGGGGHILLPSPPQPVGVFGVDSNKRINLWNEAADRVTGALSSKIGSDYTEEQDHYDSDDDSYNEDPEKTRKAFGMSFDDLFPPEIFEISTGTPQESPITMLDVLDKVLETGEPSMAVPVVSKAGRKRCRDEMANSFSVDFLPQFKSCPMFVSSTNVSGVILVCKAETMTMIRYRDESDCSNLIDMARSLTMQMDKPRSLSAGSSGTCPTENETETETETTDIIDKEIETEIDDIGNSFHTCMIDASYRTNFVDNSFRTCQIDVSGNTVKKSNRRLEALEAFGTEDDSSEEDGDDDRFFSLPSPPLLTPTQRIGNRIIDNQMGSNENYKTLFEELRTLVDTANAPIFGIDADGYVNEWNDKTAEITGYSKQDAIGRLLVETFICPDIRDSFLAILRSAVQHGEGTSNYELEFRTKSNQIRHLLLSTTPRFDINNNVVGVVLIAQDVTDSVECDRAVASMVLELQQLLENANVPVFGVDGEGKVNEWNTRMSAITGVGKDQALGLPFVENFIASSMKEKVSEILVEAYNGNETSNYEVEVTSISGEPIFLLANATTRRDLESNVIGVLGIAQDLTEDRKHTKALRELETVRASQEAKVETERNMTAYFAHELRNPLGAIDSALQAMPDKLPENAQSLVTGMQLCTKFMSSIMNNLLDVRKMEEGLIHLAAAPVSIRQIMQNVHEMLSPSVKAEVEFRKLINVKRNDWVLGDAHRIEQVLTNVVSNAIKYTVSGHIQISIEWELNYVKFVCEDTGPGIPKSEQAKLFQRFVQRGGAPGTGLGLAIAKHIVDMTGGSIRFESDPSIKAGTTCIVKMALPPCKAPESSAAAIKPEKIMDPISILVIDDIKMNRTMVKRRILKGIAPNAKIKEAATGEEALQICGTDTFDVMIVDQYMEGAGGVMVGTDVVFAMRRMRIDSVLIGCSGNDIGTQFFDAGADMVWQKPMPSNDQIIRDLRSSLDKRGFALSCTGTRK